MTKRGKSRGQIFKIGSRVVEDSGHTGVVKDYDSSRREYLVRQDNGDTLWWYEHDMESDMRRNGKKLFKNSSWTTEDKLLAGVAVVATVGIFVVVKQKKAATTAAATAGLRGLRGMGEYFATPMNGLGAYFVDPVVQQISGLGAYRGR